MLNGLASANLLSPINEEINLPKAAIDLMMGVCKRHAINFIQINQTTESEEMIKIASTKFKTLRIESVNSLNYTPPVRKNCNIFTISSLSDFIQIYDIINPQRFNYLKHFLIVSLVHLPPSQIERIFQLLWMKFILNANIVQRESRQVTVTTFYPFKAHACNDTKPVVVNYLKDGRFTNEIKFVKKLNDFKRCPIKIVAASQSEPYIIIEKNDGKISMRGRDVKLVRELSTLLNFRAEFIILEEKGFILENGSSDGLFKFLSNGSADVAVSDLWLTRLRSSFFDTTKPYATDDLIFVIPAMGEVGALQKFIYPFTTDTWILLMSCIIFGYFVIIIVKKNSKKVQNFVFGRKVKNPFLNMWIALLGTNQRPLPGRNFARFLLMNYMIMCIVLRTAYQGTMYQYIRNDYKKSEPETIDDLLRKNYNFLVLPINMDLFTQFEHLQKR